MDVDDPDHRFALMLQTQFDQEVNSNEDPDRRMALLMQQQFNHEDSMESPSADLVYERKTNSKHNSSKSLVDPSWELVDPTPNIHNLFMVFNERFFWNKLLAVCVSWSKRMTSCAGICSYQRRAGMCSITLSEPLLKLRPRKDLVETLLHEMIHAFLFITHNNRDRDGHGPEFHKHMNRINNEAGTHITVYHTFHDEVRLYKQHWWKCDGPCKMWKPYFGMVRRAMNRAPGPNDRWWGEHTRTCGGNFIKVKEPEKTEKKKKQNVIKDNQNNDIRNYFPGNISIISSSKSLINSSTPVKSQSNRIFHDNTKINNINGFHNIDKGQNNKPFRTGSTIMNAGTNVINKKPSTITRPKSNSKESNQNNLDELKSDGSENMDYSAVRNFWLNKFNDSNLKRSLNEIPCTSKRQRKDESEINDESKENVILVDCTICNKKFTNEKYRAHECINLNQSKHHHPISEKESHKEPDLTQCDVCYEYITNEDIKEHQYQCLLNLSLDFDSTISKKCEICHNKINEEIYEQHVETCMMDALSDMEDKLNSLPKVSCLVCKKQVNKDELNAHLEECMSSNVFNNKEEISEFCEDTSLLDEYNNSDRIIKDENEDNSCILIEEKRETITIVDSDEDELIKSSEDDIFDTFSDLNSSGSVSDAPNVNCPVCNKSILESKINDHLDSCLS